MIVVTLQPYLLGIWMWCVFIFAERRLVVLLSPLPGSGAEVQVCACASTVSRNATVSQHPKLHPCSEAETTTCLTYTAALRFKSALGSPKGEEVYQSQNKHARR